MFFRASRHRIRERLILQDVVCEKVPLQKVVNLDITVLGRRFGMNEK